MKCMRYVNILLNVFNVMRSFDTRIIGLSFVFLWLCLSAVELRADNTWDGGGTDDNWSTNANWNNDVLPDFNSFLYFSGKTRLTPYNDYTDLTVNGIRFHRGTGVDNFVLSGNPITLSGNIDSDTGLANGTYVQTIDLDMIINQTNSIISKGGNGDFGMAIVLSGDISGSGGLKIECPQTDNDAYITLSGNNTFTGGVYMQPRTRLYVSSDANLGDGGELAIGQNCMFYVTESFATDRAVTVNGGNPQINVDADKTFTINGSYTAAPGSTPRKGGSGTLLLNASNEWNSTALTSVSDGVFFGHSFAMNNGTLKFNAGSSKLDNLSGAPMIMNRMEGLDLTSGFDFIGTHDLDISAAQAGFVQTSGSIRNIIVVTNTLTMSGILTSGTAATGSRVDGKLGKGGSGRLVLTSVSDYTGGTVVNAGTLELQSNDALPPNGAIELSGGTLDMGTVTNTPSTLNMAADSTLALGSGQLSFTSQTNAWSGRLALTGELGRTTLRFQPPLTIAQLRQIDYAGGSVYLTADGYLRPVPRETIILVQ
jgi:autotransporter-associated beta strand protein